MQTGKFADLVAEFLVHLFADARGDRHGGDAARLRAPNHASLLTDSKGNTFRINNYNHSEQQEQEELAFV